MSCGNILSTSLTFCLCTLLLATPVSADKLIADSSITSWIESALRRDPLVDGEQVGVNTINGIVTLTGQVENLAARSRADLEAKKIRGVRGVINEISVKPVFRSDAEIVSDLRRRLLNDSVIESHGIQVSSVSGNVTLRGEVASWSEVEQAVLITSEVRGVAHVENRLTTKHSPHRSDQTIKNDVVSSMERDVYLADHPITVTVEQGIVTLTGSVGSPFEKDRAGQDIRWIPNVKSVQNDLAITPWKNRGTRAVSTRPSNAALSTAVRDELELDHRVDASAIDVKASSGVVRLEGSVPNNTQRRLAERDARDVVGVGSVDNQLFAKVDEREDWAIQADIDFNFSTDFSLEGLELDVNVKKGFVTLTGAVPDWHQRIHARNVAGRVRGVRGVANEIIVKRKTETTLERSQDDVADEIRNSLAWHWSTHRVADRIDVSMKNGVATLTGEVDSWAQRREAGRIAFSTEGVWKVVNFLTVKGYDYEWKNWTTEDPFEDHFFWGNYFGGWG